MTSFDNYLAPGKRGHLIGVGGVSMSPLAEVLAGMGLLISGSDMSEGVNVQSLREKGINVIIISIMSPVYFMQDDWESSILLCYSYSPFSFQAAFSVLAGDFEPAGNLPLTTN